MRKLFVHLRPYLKETVLSPLFKMIEAIFELLVPLAVASIIDRGIGEGDTPWLFWMFGVLLLLGLLGLGFSITAQYFAARAAVGFSARLRAVLYAHIGRLSHTELDTLGQSTVITRLTSDMNQVQTGVNLTLRLLLRSPFVVFGAMAMAFLVDAPSAVTFLALIPALMAVVFAIMLITIPLYKKVQGKLDSVLLLVRENLRGARVIRAFGQEDEEKEAFDIRNGELVAAQRGVGRISALMNPLTYVLLNAAVIWLLYIGAIRVDAGLITCGTVIALYNYMSQILVELIKFASLVITVTRSVASAHRVQAVLDIDTAREEGTVVPAPVAGAPAVEFRHASLTYRGASGPAVSDAHFHALRGETVGIIGGTGSGKSSLVSLILRAYDASEGEVLLNGQNVRAYPLTALREKIGLVPQKAQLFRGTLRDNMKVGKKTATDEEIWAALEDAQAADFVREKEGGLDFFLEAGGRNLSGGQRQRLTIARALVRQPEVLILDDSSSALDYATDAALRASIRALPYHPTVFVVSQRTASLSHADRIAVLDDGQVVGLGTHGQLLESCPVYREIYDSQYKKEGCQNV